MSSVLSSEGDGSTGIFRPPVPSPSPNAYLVCAVLPDETASRPESPAEEPLIPPGSSASRPSVGFEQGRTKGGCGELPWFPERGLACLFGWNAALLSYYLQAWTIDANEQPNPVFPQTLLRADRVPAPSSHGLSLCLIPASHPQVPAPAAVHIPTPGPPTHVFTKTPLRLQHSRLSAHRFSLWPGLAQRQLVPRAERQPVS